MVRRPQTDRPLCPGRGVPSHGYESSQCQKSQLRRSAWLDERRQQMLALWCGPPNKTEDYDWITCDYSGHVASRPIKERRESCLNHVVTREVDHDEWVSLLALPRRCAASLRLAGRPSLNPRSK